MQVEDFPELRPMGDDLRRQRRNLIIMCLLLLFMKYGGVTINKLSVFGAEIILSNVLAIYVVLWLIWLYFLVRYSQYFWQEGLTILKSAIREATKTFCSPKVAELARRNYKPSIYNLTMFNYNYMKKINWYTREFSDREIETDELGSPIGNRVSFSIKIWSLWKELLRSYYQVIIKQSMGTDYFFPFIFSLLVFYYCNYGDWQGNLFNIFFFK